MECDVHSSIYSFYEVTHLIFSINIAIYHLVFNSNSYFFFKMNKNGLSKSSSEASLSDLLDFSVKKKRNSKLQVLLDYLKTIHFYLSSNARKV